jgi:hypothetical protein
VIWAGDEAEAVEHLPHKHKVLSSNPSTPKKKRRRKKKRKIQIAVV